MILIKGLPGLIGDAIGTLPAIVELSKKDDIILQLNSAGSNAKEIYQMIPKKYNTNIVDESFEISHTCQIIDFNLSKSFDFATKNNRLHMIQSAFHMFGLPIPSNIPKPELEFEDIDIPICDYVVSPFSRSLPLNQLWHQDAYNKLVDRMEDKTFVILGHDKFDPVNYIFNKPHVKDMYNQPLLKVMNLLKKSKHGLLSVTTGPSHMSYALNVKNYLFYNQPAMIWGRNPDAILLDKHIPDYTPQEVEKILRSNV